MDWNGAARVLLLSAAPIAELRGGIPLALALGFSPPLAYGLALVGNLLPVPLLLWGLSWLLPLLPRLPGAFGRLAFRYRAWQERRHRTRFLRYGPWALLLFVAVPFPATGAWTGVFLAALFGIPPRRAFPPILVGVAIAGILVLLASLGAFALFWSCTGQGPLAGI